MSPKEVCAALAVAAAASCAHAAPDADAAQALIRQNNCLRCHAVDREKEGPAFKRVAREYRNDAKAEERLVLHLTSGPTVTFQDGHEERHKVIATTPEKDLKQIRNLVQWLLSQ